MVCTMEVLFSLRTLDELPDYRHRSLKCNVHFDIADVELAKCVVHFGAFKSVLYTLGRSKVCCTLWGVQKLETTSCSSWPSDNLKDGLTGKSLTSYY